MYQASVGYLSAWQQKNYGRMAGYLPVALSGTTPNQTAGRVRSEAELFELTSFTMGALHFEAPAICEAEVMLVLDGEERRGRLRWCREAVDGSPVTPDEKGTWRLYLWGPLAILNRAQDRDAS